MSKRNKLIIDHITKEISEKNLSELDLKIAVGLCSWNLIYCNKCISTLAISCEQLSDNKPWCIKLDYSKYKSIWYVCNSYQRFRNRIIIFYQLSRYQKIYYSIINTIVTEHDNIHSNNPDQSILTNILLTDIVSGIDRKSLITKTIGIRTNVTLLDNENVEIIFTLSQLVNILSRNKNEMLVSVLNNVVGCTRKQYQKEL